MGWGPLQKNVMLLLIQCIIFIIFEINNDDSMQKKNADLMIIPIDDRMANRAHGVTETGNIRGFKFAVVINIIIES